MNDVFVRVTRFIVDEVSVMKKNIVITLSLIAAFAVSPVVQAKKYTISDREVSLEKKVDAAYKANQLTLKEADNLKSKLSDVKDEEVKMKQKNGGKLSYENLTKLEKDLNKISEKLQHKMLEKRVQ